MANKFTPVTDLETYWNTNFVHDNVSGISGKPTFTRKAEGLTPSSSVTGVVQFKASRLEQTEGKGDYYRNEFFAIDVEIYFEGNETTIREILGELDRLNNVNNQLSNRTYQYNIIYDWDGDIDIGKMKCTVLAKKYFVGVPIA